MDGALLIAIAGLTISVIAMKLQLRRLERRIDRLGGFDRYGSSVFGKGVCQAPDSDSFTQRQLIEAVARGWWDAFDTDREIDWGDIADLCVYISEAMPSPATAD